MKKRNRKLKGSGASRTVPLPNVGRNADNSKSAIFATSKPMPQGAIAPARLSESTRALVAAELASDSTKPRANEAPRSNMEAGKD